MSVYHSSQQRTGRRTPEENTVEKNLEIYRMKVTNETTLSRDETRAQRCPIWKKSESLHLLISLRYQRYQKGDIFFSPSGIVSCHGIQNMPVTDEVAVAFLKVAGNACGFASPAILYAVYNLIIGASFASKYRFL